MAALSTSVLGSRKNPEVNADKKICKIYVVLHGQGVRAQDDNQDGGNVGTDEKPNFFVLGEGLDDSVDIKLFRMVAPGMVFMSHTDINKKFRERLLKHPLDNWLEHIKNYYTLTHRQIAAPPHHGQEEGPESERNIKSRSIFRQLLQLFHKGDSLTNERLLSDFGTGEARLEFGVWITEENEFPTNPQISSTSEAFLNGFGSEKEITLQDLINKIIEQNGCSHYEFYIANCSPIPSDDRAAVTRLKKKETPQSSNWERPGQYSAVTLNDKPKNINFWLNTLYIHYKRLKNYHLGKANLNSFINRSHPQEQTERKQMERPQVPSTDTIWGLMDSEERQDHYKLINGLLHMYPHFLKGKEEEETKTIKDMMIFIIKTITTPFNERIRGGRPHEKGASQVTKYSGTVENAPGSGGASKVGEGYYTLSQGVANKIAAVIRGEYVIPGVAADDARETSSHYKEMLQNVYGMGKGEIKNSVSVNYPFKPDTDVAELHNVLKLVGGNKLRKKKTRKKRKRRRKKTKRKKKKRKNKTRKKKRRRKKRTKRNKQN